MVFLQENSVHQVARLLPSRSEICPCPKQGRTAPQNRLGLDYTSVIQYSRSNPGVSNLLKPRRLDMTTLDIESGLPKASWPLLFPHYLEERITSPPEVQKILIAPAPPSTVSMEIPANPNGITTTPSDTMYKINIGDVQHEQILDSLPQPPFFNMASVFKSFTFSCPSSAESVAAFLPPGADQC